jgi:hypothetical protein
MGERIRITNGEVWLDEDNGIVRVSHETRVSVTLAAAKEQIAAVAKVSKGKRFPLLVDLRNPFTGPEAREYFASEESRAAWRAVALLSTTPTGTATGKMWVAAYETPDNPARVYYSETEAIEWLKGFLDR